MGINDEKVRIREDKKLAKDLEKLEKKYEREQKRCYSEKHSVSQGRIKIDKRNVFKFRVKLYLFSNHLSKNT